MAHASACCCGLQPTVRPARAEARTSTLWRNSLQPVDNAQSKTSVQESGFPGRRKSSSLVWSRNAAVWLSSNPDSNWLISRRGAGLYPAADLQSAGRLEKPPQAESPMPYSFAAFEHLADVGRAPSPAAGAPAGLLPYATTLLSARPAGPGAPRRPGGLPHKRTSTQLAVEKLYGIGLKACPTNASQVTGSCGTRAAGPTNSTKYLALG